MKLKDDLKENKSLSEYLFNLILIFMFSEYKIIMRLFKKEEKSSEFCSDDKVKGRENG